MSTTKDNRLIQPYLFFNGRCEEAIAFYRKALGADVEIMMRHKESPDPHPPDLLPAGFENKIMHASLRVGAITLMVSDGCSAGPTNFQGFSLSLSVGSEAEAERVFAALAEGGEAKMPLTKTFWSPCFGMVQDKFGVGWMVTVFPPAQN